MLNKLLLHACDDAGVVGVTSPFDLRRNTVRFGKATLVIAAATALLCALVGSASAGRLSISSQTGRATFRELKFTGGFGTTNCPITVEGSFHSRTIAKIANALIGYVTRAILGVCSQGAATILSETLPWHVRYSSFSGTLPAITSIVIRLLGLSFQIREPVFGITCLARGTEVSSSVGTFNREAGGALTTAVSSGRVPTNCGTEGELTGTSSSFTVLGSATRITVTLI
jgi:hypothetical protein